VKIEIFKSNRERAEGGLSSFLRGGAAPPQKFEGGHLPPLSPWIRRHCVGLICLNCGTCRSGMHDLHLYKAYAEQ